MLVTCLCDQGTFCFRNLQPGLKGIVRSQIVLFYQMLKLRRGVDETTSFSSC